MALSGDQWLSSVCAHRDGDGDEGAPRAGAVEAGGLLDAGRGRAETALSAVVRAAVRSPVASWQRARSAKSRIRGGRTVSSRARARTRSAASHAFRPTARASSYRLKTRNPEVSSPSTRARTRETPRQRPLPARGRRTAVRRHALPGRHQRLVQSVQAEPRLCPRMRQGRPPRRWPPYVRHGRRRLRPGRPTPRKRRQCAHQPHPFRPLLDRQPTVTATGRSLIEPGPLTDEPGPRRLRTVAHARPRGLEWEQSG